MLKKRTRVKKTLSPKKYNEVKKNNRKTFFSYIRQELENSTIHGLAYILNSRLHFVERLFWLICFTGSVTFTICLLSAQYTRLINSPTVMSVEMNYFDWNISYPAITLCPLPKTNTTLYQQFLNEMFHKTGLHGDIFFWGVVSSGMDGLDVTYLDIPKNLSSTFHPNGYSKLAAEVFRKFPDNSLTTNPNRNITLHAAMTEVGMCHVINSNVAVYDNPLSWSGETQEYIRTNVELTVYEGDFLTQVTNYTENFKVYIHHPDEPILSTSPSYTFNVGGYLTFGLSVWSTRISDEIRLKPISLRKCRFVNEPLNTRYPVYSYNRCIIECRIGIILQLCGCVPQFYKPLPSERVCSINELKCVRKYKKEITSLKIPEHLIKRSQNSRKHLKSVKNCGCLDNCEKDIYQKDYENFVFEKFLSKLQVGITGFPRSRIVRDVIFRTNDILLKSGGVVNLFIGSSLISFIELLVIVPKLLIYLVYTYFRKHQNIT